MFPTYGAPGQFDLYLSQRLYSDPFLEGHIPFIE